MKRINLTKPVTRRISRHPTTGVKQAPKSKAVEALEALGHLEELVYGLLVANGVKLPVLRTLVATAHNWDLDTESFVDLFQTVAFLSRFFGPEDPHLTVVDQIIEKAVRRVKEATKAA